MNAWLRNRSLFTKVLWGMLVFVSLAFWLSDGITTFTVSRAFDVQLHEILEESAFQQRNHFARAIDSYPQTIGLLASRQPLVMYLEHLGPIRNKPLEIHKEAPPWMNSILFSRAFIAPSYIFIFDSDGHATDVYRPPSGLIHQELAHIDKHTLDKYINHSIIMQISDVPHLLAAQKVLSSTGEVLGYILCATHIDEDFLIIVNGPPTRWNLMVLIDTSGDKIMASNDTATLPIGTMLNSLSNNYIFSPPKRLALSGMEMNYALASIVNKESAELLYHSVLMKQRLTHLMQASLYVVPLIVIALWLTRRIARLTRSVEDYTRQKLAVSSPATEIMGDQISSLEQCFNRLKQAITQRTSQLEATNRELEAFSYSVSHDLRAPLRGIDGFSQALSEDYEHLLDQQGQDYLARIRRAAQRMGDLIDGMLLLSRINRSDMKYERIDLSEMVLSQLEELRQGQPERDACFSVQPGTTVWGDRGILEIALRNLLGNAWKFTSKRAHTRIEFGQVAGNCPMVSTLPDQNIFYIKDNGAGFNGAYASKLFTAFQRLHSSDDFPGTGIGLAIVQRVINRHEGTVWAEGHVDQGATFFFSLGGQP